MTALPIQILQSVPDSQLPTKCQAVTCALTKLYTFRSGARDARDADVLDVDNYPVYRAGNVQSASAIARGMTVFFTTTIDILNCLIH